MLQYLLQLMPNAHQSHTVFGPIQQRIRTLQNCCGQSLLQAFQASKTTYTLMDVIYHIADFSEKHFNSFDSLPIEIKKQMISHLKALVKSFENQE